MSSAEPIRRLPAELVAKIAAGEVVERPASVAKELIENALDAGAARIEIEYEDRDHRRVMVTDDGRGIEPDQVELALTRHATSKIRRLDDLDRIVSLGFRGEALASIAAVAEVEMTTRARARQDACRVVVREGKILDFTEGAFSPGTRVDVRDLFAAVPAREKFLKSRATEFSALVDSVRAYALGYPAVGFFLTRNGRETVACPAVSDLAARVAQVMGAENAASMIPVDASHGGMRLRGLASTPGVSHGSHRWVSWFVNRRWVRDRLLFRALMDAYKTFLLRGRYPAAALFLEVEAAQVDVNVHPAKTEVRFESPEKVGGFVVEAVRTAVREGSSPLGRWGAEASALHVKDAVVRARGYRRGSPRGISAVSESRAAAGRAGGASESAPREAPARRPGALSGYRVPREQARTPAEPTQAALAAHGMGEENRLAGLEVVGQVLEGYIVCRSADAMVLVDQHAAHERFLFERLMACHAAGDVPTQALLIPAVVELPEADASALCEARAWLADAGWEIEPLGPREVIVRAQPVLAAAGDPRLTVEAVAADLVDDGRSRALEGKVEKVAATVSCHAAVRIGKRLHREAARALLEEVAAVGFSACCPHGRPVARALSRSRIERLFDR